MKKILLLTILFLFILNIQNIHAQEIKLDKVFINEIFPDPEGTDTGKEWLELFNNSEDSVNLKDFKIVSESESGIKREIILTEYILEPFKYVIILEDINIFSSENKIVIPAGKINLYNSNSKIYLHDSLGDIIDEANYSSANSGKSLERKGPLENAECKKFTGNLTGNSLGSENLNILDECFGREAEIVEPTIQISEAYPTPLPGNDEWIEFYNFSEKEISLKNWRLTDDSGSFYIINFDFIVGAKMHKTINSKSFSISLNNSGDKIILTNSKNEVIDEFLFDKTNSKESRSRIYLENTKKYETVYANSIVPKSKILTPDNFNKFEVQEEVIEEEPVKSVKINWQSTPIIPLKEKPKITYKLPGSNILATENSNHKVQTTIHLWPIYLIGLTGELVYIYYINKGFIWSRMLKYKSNFSNFQDQAVKLEELFR